MKTYSYTEVLQAREKIARPISDFIDSKAFQNIIDGFEVKFGFSVEQKTLSTSIIIATLVQLEPQSALETNIHQLLPELSNEKTTELAADIRDRAIKEADRRVKEGIIDPRFDWDEGIFGERPTFEQLEARKKRFREEAQRALPPEEVARLAEIDFRKQQEEEDREEAEYAANQKAQGIVPLSEDEGESEEPPLEEAPRTELAATIPRKTLGLSTDRERLSETFSTEAQIAPNLLPPAVPIALQKLSIPSTVQEKLDEIPNSLAQTNISKISKADQAPPKASDPYREPTE